MWTLLFFLFFLFFSFVLQMFIFSFFCKAVYGEQEHWDTSL